MNSEFLTFLAILALSCLVTCRACLSNPLQKNKSRYLIEREAPPSSRSYVLDKHSKKYLQRQVQLRVSKERKLPPEFISKEHGNLLSSTKFSPGYCGSGNLNPAKYASKGSYYVWQFKDTFDADDFSGKKAFAVGISWPKPQGGTEKEAIEVFSYEKAENMEPYTWTAWKEAERRRDGEFAWLAEAYKQAEDSKIQIEHPFQLRWRLTLTEQPLIYDDDQEIQD